MQETQKTRVQSLGREDPLEKGMTTCFSIQYFLTKKFHGQRSLVGYSPWGHKESGMTECLSSEHTCTQPNGEAGVREKPDPLD